jgi:GT2 family glycosyltransferase
MTDSSGQAAVVVCAYSEERWPDLAAAVASVQQQTVAPEEIAVVIDHNRSLFERAVSGFPGVLVLENYGPRGASGARNSGVAATRAEIIAFIDDDALAFPDWIEQLLAGFGAPDVLGVGGKAEPAWPCGRPSWFPEEFDWVVGSSYAGMPAVETPVRNLWTVNMAVRREVFDALSGFRTNFGKVGMRSSPEDTDFCLRALQCWPKGKWLYKPNARVRHSVPASRATWKYFLRRCYYEGCGKAHLARLVGSGVSLSAERKHAFLTLPRGMLRGLGQSVRTREVAGIGRAGAIAAGLALASTGYLAGSLFPRVLERPATRRFA